MSGIVFERTIQRIQIEKQPRTYRIMTGGQGPAGNNGNVFSPDGSVAQIIALTQVEYDLLTPDATTFYIIKPEV